MREYESTVQRAILEMDESFTVPEVFNILNRLGIRDKDLALTVLDNMLNSGTVEYDGNIFGHSRYRSVLAQR